MKGEWDQCEADKHKGENPIHEADGAWYFWDECWADRIGPWESRHDAEYAIHIYQNFLTERTEKMDYANTLKKRNENLNKLRERVSRLESANSNLQRQLDQCINAEMSESQIEQVIQQRVSDALEGKPHICYNPRYDQWVGECGHRWLKNQTDQCPLCLIRKIKELAQDTSELPIRALNKIIAQTVDFK